MKLSTKRMIESINAARVAAGERRIAAKKAKPVKKSKCVGCFDDVHSVGCPNRKSGK